MVHVWSTDPTFRPYKCGFPQARQKLKIDGEKSRGKGLRDAAKDFAYTTQHFSARRCDVWDNYDHLVHVPMSLRARTSVLDG